MPVLKKEMDLAGRTLSVEVGRVAKQAGGAVFVRYGETAIVVTATMSDRVREGIDFFPLTCDYEERLYAVGRIPGGFIKREGRPSEKAVLSSRLMDRPLRPLFPKGMRNEVQVVALVMSVDQDNPPDVTAMVGASAALAVSQIPFGGPIGAVVVGRVDGELVLNPTVEQAGKSDLHLTVAGTRDAVMMVEARAGEVPEDVALEAIAFGHRAIGRIVEFIDALREEALGMGLAKPKAEPVLARPDEQVVEAVTATAYERLVQAANYVAAESVDKKTREAYLDKVKDEITASFADRLADREKQVREVVDACEKKAVRRLILEDKKRIDGRALNEVRPITVEAGVLPRVHGSGLFTRGQTQVLSVVTLGPISDEQILDGLGIEESKRFMHHYNFPPFSTGETRPMRSPGRREIGHGALAEKALITVIPPEEAFPYTIRIVSEVLESNGSTSMGSVCASMLALMDAGVPAKGTVSGVAMGLVKEGDRFEILTDIQGVEDHLGDMDFKVAGTRNGITALQMDIKVAGVDREVLGRALAQAREGRLFILDRMLAVIPEPRPELSPLAPRIINFSIDPDKIREVIGPGGKIIRKIIEETGTQIDIEDDGRVFIASVNPDGARRAMEIIGNLTREVEVGQIYNGRVTRCTDFGCFVEVVPGAMGVPGKEGLVHISQLAHYRVEKTEDIVKEGDRILVKVIGYDPQGRMKLSKKDVAPPTPEEEQRRAAAGGERDRDFRRHDGPRPGGGRPGGGPRRDGYRPG
ncbi:MAG: polyribonucleotide nucleotidyltransferase [Peptococcaceae bacterium]|jgi:polyribonucleotide nucleotidyltransferase|nr:polyribonucleotide nucleotidyltransferase [Peptococcaceae bacterium]